MSTFTVEMRANADDGEQALRSLERLGARRIAGYRPIPMRPLARGTAATMVLTVEVADVKTLQGIRALPDVVQVYEDPTIEPFAGPFNVAG